MAEDLPVQIDKRLMRRAFEHAAHSYDQAAVLQREVNQRMLERLDWVKLDPHWVLDAGAGTGVGARALASRYPKARVLGLDIAQTMLQVARDRDPWWKRSLSYLTGNLPQYVGGDISRLPLKTSSVNLLWSNLALQWCDDLQSAFSEFQRVLAPGGLLMFSTFGPDTLRELRQAFSGLDGHTHVNRFVDLHDIGDQLLYAGFSAPVMDMDMMTVTYPDVTALLRELKAIGAHNVTSGRGHGLMGKRKWQAMLQRYELLRKDGRLPATFEVVYGHAWVNEKKPKRADGQQVIEFKIQARQAGLR
ncbi:MAG: malonyl-[acyl-carrier protein] O-methyltransferase BioC [Betaproteobacteria bacterium RBG_16_58_11]|nr:MAG: malonyl-[acyl-carrier protein] O-methyltransferase BioC [Betaproteobacteria bacterium RBG_16_58_11]